MEAIGTTVMVSYVPIMLDFVALKDFGKYKLNLQLIILTGAPLTPELFEKIGEGFLKHGLDKPEILSGYGSTELGEENLSEILTIDRDHFS